jgi:transketolase
MLRATPNLSVWRPCDTTETACAWEYAIKNKSGPTALVLTRQKVVFQFRDEQALKNIERGGYILIDTSINNNPDWILIATGSEVELAIIIARKLQDKNISTRVVSMPSQDVFDKQDDAYKNKVLPGNITKRLAIEAATSQSWFKYVGISGKIMGLDRYGESAQDKILFEFFGFSAQNGLDLISAT